MEKETLESHEPTLESVFDAMHRILASPYQNWLIHLGKKTSPSTATAKSFIVRGYAGVITRLALCARARGKVC